MPAGPMRNLVTGGAGFLGSHLVDRLMQAGEEVLCLDNTFTGRKANVRQWWDHPRFEFIHHDVTEPIKLEVDRISRLVVQKLFGTVTGKRLAVLGFAFKADTNDTREAPVIRICRDLLEEGAQLAIHDPKVET